MVNWGYCDNTLLLCKTCLHAVYHRPIMGGREGFYWGAEKNCPENNNLLQKQTIYTDALKLTFLVQPEWGLKPLINLFYTIEFAYNGFVCNVNSPIMLHFVRFRWYLLPAFQFAWNVNSAITVFMQSPRGAVTGKFCSYLACQLKGVKLLACCVLPDNKLYGNCLYWCKYVRDFDDATQCL